MLGHERTLAIWNSGGVLHRHFGGKPILILRAPPGPSADPKLDRHTHTTKKCRAERGYTGMTAA